MKKRNSIYGRIVRMVITVDIMMIFLLFCGYSTATRVMNSENPESYVNHYKIFCLIVVIVFAIILTVIFRRIMKTIRVGFRQITEITQNMAMGKVDIELPPDKNDEFGELFKEYGILLEASRNQALLADEVANADMTTEIIPRSEDDVLGKALEKMVKETNASLTELRDSVQIVYEKTNEVAAASNNLAQGSTEQASAIEEITASIAEVTQDTKNNAVEANTAEELIETALKNVISGNDKMSSMMQAIKDINSASENISKIIKTIDDIAFQTNILALNAAVEAARAGEAGRGFAVVAEEVRNLAAKSAEAASETAELIESSIKITEVGTEIAGETSEMFDIITDNVKQSANIISKIADSSHNQVTTLEQIDIAIDQVSQVVQNNSSISEVCAEASTDLANKSSDMKNLIMRYKL